MKKQDDRIEFKTKTPEEKKLYESKWKELGYSNRSDMIRTAVNQHIDRSDESSPEVLRLQQELSMEKEQRMELEAKLTKTSNAYQYIQGENKELRIENYGSVNGLNAVLMGRQIDHFIKMQNGVTRANILSAVDRSEKIQGLWEFLNDYTNLLLEEGSIINMLDGKKEVLRWIEQTKN
jgi:Arc/MetJ-type ribon-helix-helix transcriptional regulator